jgi:hypothetical protein
MASVLVNFGPVVLVAVEPSADAVLPVPVTTAQGDSVTVCQLLSKVSVEIAPSVTVKVIVMSW